jgi:hypothetical protein
MRALFFSTAALIGAPHPTEVRRLAVRLEHFAERKKPPCNYRATRLIATKTPAAAFQKLVKKA